MHLPHLKTAAPAPEPAPIEAELGPEHDLSYFASTENPRYALSRLQYSPDRRHLTGCNGRQLAVVPMDAGDFPFQLDAAAVHDETVGHGTIRRLRLEHRGGVLVLHSYDEEGAAVERVAGTDNDMGKWPQYDRMGPLQPAWVPVATICLGIHQLGLIIDYARSIPGTAQGALSLAIGGMRWGLLGDEIVWLLRDRNLNAVAAGMVMPMADDDPRGATMQALRMLRGPNP